MPKTYRILSTAIPGGASGAGHRYERICVESRYHATIVRWERDLELDHIEKIEACDCVDHDVFPELLAAIKAADRDA